MVKTQKTRNSVGKKKRASIPRRLTPVSTGAWARLQEIVCQNDAYMSYVIYDARTKWSMRSDGCHFEGLPIEIWVRGEALGRSQIVSTEAAF